MTFGTFSHAKVHEAQGTFRLLFDSLRASAHDAPRLFFFLKKSDIFLRKVLFFYKIITESRERNKKP